MLADHTMITGDLIAIPDSTIQDNGFAEGRAEGRAEGQAFHPGTTLREYKSKQTESAERLYLEELLHHTRGRINEAAQLAGLTPRAIYDKMKAYGLRKEDFKLSS